MTAAALAQRGYAALARRDVGEILAVLHPDVELATVGSGTFNGHGGIRSWIAEMDSSYADWAVEVEDVIEVSEELVVLVTVFGGRGRQSGIEAGQRFWVVWRTHAGLLWRGSHHTEPGPAERLVGITLPPARRQLIGYERPAEAQESATGRPDPA